MHLNVTRDSLQHRKCFVSTLSHKKIYLILHFTRGDVNITKDYCGLNTTKADCSLNVATAHCRLSSYLIWHRFLLDALSKTTLPINPHMGQTLQCTSLCIILAL